MDTKQRVTERPKTDFISFILDAEKDDKLTLKFISAKTAAELYKFFKDAGYTGIPEDDCEYILEARIRWEKLTPVGHGKPPCEGINKGY